MKRLRLLLLLVLTGWSGLSAQSFRKGYKAYAKKHDYPIAKAIFKKHLDDKFGAGSRLYLAQMAETAINHPDSLLALDSTLRVASEKWAGLSRRKAGRQTKKYGISQAAITDVRKRLQIRAIDLVRSRNSVSALDSLLARLTAPLPEVAPYLDSNRVWIVNNLLDSWDYATATAILNNHWQVIKPENYTVSRNLPDRVFKLFQRKYSLCRLDRFVRDHPRSYISHDCWWEEAQQAFCKNNLEALLDFHARVPWTALEFTVINRVLELLKTEQAVNLSTRQMQHLDDMRNIYPLSDRLQAGYLDSAGISSLVEPYIARYAPRYSTFSLLQQTVQFYLEDRAYGKAVSFLNAMRDYFPDTLPATCHSNFDFQTRVRPYINGLIPLLEKPELPLESHPIREINTEAGDESNPVLSNNGDTLYFAGAGRPDNLAGQDVFISVRSATGQWSPPRIVPVFSGKGNQAPLSLAANGSQFLLRIDGRLYRSAKTKSGEWGQPVPVKLDGLAAIGKAVLSADGKTMVLEGADSGGNALQGPDMDLYYSKLDASGHWSTPEGMGASINTDRQEANPYLGADGKTLYYTSTGYPGLGKSDVFVARLRESDWSHWERPVNLGKIVNDTYNHHGFGYVSPDGRKAVFVKYMRDGEKGDIWETELPK